MCEVITEKKCIACLEVKPVSCFHKRKLSNDGVHYYCKKCLLSKSTTYRKNTIDKNKDLLNSTPYLSVRCRDCGVIKKLSEFKRRNDSPSGFSRQCLACNKIYQKNLHLNKKEERREAAIIYYRENRDRILEKKKEHYAVNRDNHLNRCRRWYVSNVDRKKIKDAEYSRLNRDKINKRSREYTKNKRITDAGWKIEMNIRRRVGLAIKSGNKSAPTLSLLGCSREFFKVYFESKFTKGMTWEAFMRGEIHIDHKIPCAAFNLADPEQQKICFHYSNLQPLWKLDNLRKGARILKPIQIHLPI